MLTGIAAPRGAPRRIYCDYGSEAQSRLGDPQLGSESDYLWVNSRARRRETISSSWFCKTFSQKLAERAGFEPAIGGNPILAFQASAFDRSATSPTLKPSCPGTLRSAPGEFVGPAITAPNYGRPRTSTPGEGRGFYGPVFPATRAARRLGLREGRDHPGDVARAPTASAPRLASSGPMSSRTRLPRRRPEKAESTDTGHDSEGIN